ncbi:MAG: hypothetical protein M1828_005351 [Chrysothrix sp. TS-e1954]|nr:MAG: hypothetical protein M1828_005351 [Chrysothrix sp. TS-e1954]
MHMSKETRIKIFIAVDVVFFLIEIVIGYVSHSLALVADSFHMLNDVISLCVGLWAVRVAAKRSASNEYTYGWARAELIGGLVNGVFLVALCVSIILEAIQRFFEPQEVSKPELVLIVGGVGLVFNILGLVIFGHGHDHSHGDESGEEEHAHHEHTHDIGHAENGHSTHYGSIEQTPVAKNDGAAESKKTSARVSSEQVKPASQKVTWEEGANTLRPSDDGSRRRLSTGSRRSGGRRSSTRSRHGLADGPIHPASLRNNIHALANAAADTDSEDEESQRAERQANDHQDETDGEPTEVTSLLKVGPFNTRTLLSTNTNSSDQTNNSSDRDISHNDHNHAQPQARQKSHHEHDSNIRGIFLHVLGDALGNVGVMASALIIWLTPWSFRFYFDPIISLLITLIILKSALPLCFDTSRHLLQAVPSHVSIEEIREDIKCLPGIRDCHHIHVWALTPSKLIATLDVEVDFDFAASGQSRYMVLAKEIKKCLRGHGIHSSTIQPEFVSAEQVALTNGEPACQDANTKQCCGPTI